MGQAGVGSPPVGFGVGGLVSRVFPPDVVDEVIAEAGRTQARQRALPARVMAYFSIGMALYSEGSYEDVFAQLTDGLSWTTGWAQSWSPPTKSAIFQARSRLGCEPMRDLFVRVARPVARAGMPGSWLAGRRVVAIDGTCVDVPDTVVNAEFFGRPASSRGRVRVSASPAGRGGRVRHSCGVRRRNRSVPHLGDRVGPRAGGPIHPRDAGAGRPRALRIQAVESSRCYRR